MGTINGTFRGGVVPPKKSGLPPIDLEPQTISEAIAAAFGTAEFWRATSYSSQGWKKVKIMKSYRFFFLQL